MAISTTQWLDAFFDSYYRYRPVNATFIGVHEHDNRLPDYSQEGISSQLAEIRQLLEQVDREKVATPETQWEAIDRMLARNFLLTQVWELGETDVVLGNPCLYTGEAIFGIVSLFLRDYAPIDQRVVAAVDRLNAIPKLLQQGQTNVMSCPSAWIDRAVNECDGVEKLLTDGVEVLRTKYGVTREEFHTAVTVARDAFRDFRKHLQDVLVPAGHDNYAVGAQPFEMLLRLGHCIDMDGLEVSTYAYRRMEEARQLLRDGAAQVDPEASPQELLAKLTDIHPSWDEYYLAFQLEFDRAKAFAVERDLLTWPDYPITFEPIPDWAQSAAPHLYFLFYRAPAPFDTHVTQRYLVTPIEPEMPDEEQERRLRATNSSQVRLNHIIHHGGIGHHVQNWWAYRAPSRIGRMAAVDTALRVAMLGGGTMAEGWACYATDLMAEQGYVSDLEQLAEHQGLARMAARAIVDVGLHRGEMTFDEAVTFYRDEVGMPEAASRSEVVKNSMFPGAAMMYLVGTDMIHDLRETLRDRDGGTFSLRQFHDTFLSHGSIPVALIAKLMKGETITAEGYFAPLA